jgi:DNA helicase II / ATP-dependent DNA helicase PcrA
VVVAAGEQKMTNQTKRTWSPQQKKIFSWFKSGHGHLVVRARAGTGKTSTIIEAVERYAPESRILLAAFNKQIATELQSRIRSPHVQVKTLHGLGFSFIRSMWGSVQVDTDGNRELDLAQKVCSPDDPHEAVRLIGRIHTKVRELQPHRSSPEDILDLMVDQDLMPEESLEVEDGIDARWIAQRASQAVDLAKLRTNLIDFADMIFLPLAHNAVKPWYDLVVVDEAQDMSEPQLEMATKACSSHGRIAVVGDDRQAIYGFRGADSGSLDRLKKNLNAAELGLTVTYRCPKSVVQIAREIVADFSAAATAPDGTIEHCSDLSLTTLAQPGDFILSRTNAPLVKVCLALLRAGKRATIRGRDIGRGIVTLVDRQKARDLVSLSKKLSVWVDRETKRARTTLAESATENRIAYVQDVAGVVSALSEDVATVNELRSKLSTLFVQEPGNSIVCSSTHKAKGLEARNVFLLSGTFQGKRAGEIEERNLLYVAVTRSMHRLIWVSGFEK